MWSRRFTVPQSYLLPFLAACLLVIQLGLSLSDLPSIRLMQDIVCKNFHGVTSDDPLPEEECRSKPVQQRFNTIAIGILVSVTISNAVVAFPLGVLADQIGRVPVLGFSIFGMLLSQAYAMLVCWQWKKIPIEAIWGLGVPLLIGGGRSVAEAMVFAIISDAVPPAKRHWIVAAVLSGQILGPILAGGLVKSSIWTPLWMSLGLTFAGGFVLVAFSPETLTRKQALDDFALEQPKETASTKTTLKLTFTRPLLWLLPGAVLTIPLATIQSDLLIRLMPVQFGWPLDHSVLLISLRSLVTLLTLCLLLPSIAYLWSKLKADPSPHYRDSVVARGSSLVSLAGSMCIMMVTDEALVITGLAISALGSGLPTLCRAMLIGETGEERAGTVFGVLAAWEVLGFLACEVGMGALFGAGDSDMDGSDEIAGDDGRMNEHDVKEK
ncbi:hypothetical protein ACJ41O_004983 [Fusarium nematophilum]